jgi:enoyl-CoA hydratase
MELETLIYEREKDLAIVTFNRPEAMNASNATSVKELNRVVDEIEADDEIKAVVMWGGPKVFAAGGDIKYMSEAKPLEAEKFIARAHAVHDKIAASGKPYVAAIAGLALGGGCELALACDIRIAAENSYFGQPEINIGIIPGAGGTQRLNRVVGSGWARHLILTGEIIDAKTAFKIGLVTKLVPPEELFETAKKFAKSLGHKSPNAVSAAKKCLFLSETTDMPTGLAYEQKAWAFLFGTEDQTEGMKAFLEKRRPNYQGK